MTLDRVRTECRVMGKGVWLIPLGVVCSTALFAGIELFTARQGGEIARLVTASLEIFLPLTVGLIVATTSMQDATRELLLTMPSSYRSILLYRCALSTGWAVGPAFGTSLVLGPLKLWMIPTQLESWALLSQLVVGMLGWCAPLLWFASAALCLSLLFKSRSASGALLGLIWTAEVFFVHPIAATTWLRPVLLFATTFTPTVPFWLDNRAELLGLAALFLVVSLMLLCNSEAFLQASQGEEQ